jgi:hypothetical protein
MREFPRTLLVIGDLRDRLLLYTSRSLATIRITLRTLGDYPPTLGYLDLVPTPSEPQERKGWPPYSAGMICCPIHRAQWTRDATER